MKRPCWYIRLMDRIMLRLGYEPLWPQSAIADFYLGRRIREGLETYCEANNRDPAGWHVTSVGVAPVNRLSDRPMKFERVKPTGKPELRIIPGGRK